MTLKQRLDQDLKTALLGGDKILATTLRGLKGAILDVEVAEGKRDQGLDDETIIRIFAKEAKKRQESAELYRQGGRPESAEAELAEKAVIEQYLPQQMDDAELSSLIDKAIAELSASGPQAMGKVIGAVKAAAGSRVDGGRLAAQVKERLGA